MKSLPTNLKRCLALVLSLALIVSSLHLSGNLKVNAGNDTTSVTAGALVAENYSELSAEEKALLSSGLLLGDTYTYTTPENDDNLVSVDSDAKKVTVKPYKTGDYTWAPMVAAIVVNEERVETITLTEENGEYVGTYEYAENAFSVDVDYQLNIQVDEDTQKTLLGAAAQLKNGLAALKAVSGLDFTAIHISLPKMETLASKDGMPVTIPNTTMEAYIGFTPTVKAKVNALLDQMEANGNKIDLAVMVSEYKTAASKVQYLLEKGASIKACLDETYDAIKALSEDELFTNETQLNWIYGYDATLYDYILMLKSSLDTWVEKATEALAYDWSAVASGTALVQSGIDAEGYADLDKLAGALQTVADASAITVKPLLKAGETTVRLNMSMFDVTVEVALKLANGVAGSTELVTYDTNKVTVTLAEGVSAKDILNAVEKSGVEAEAQTEWADVYVAGKFDTVNGELPETLTADTTYTITYVPKTYTITYSYDGTTAEVPYGYILELPRAEEADKAYDYNVGGVTYIQGQLVTIVDDVTITREEGKSYTAFDLIALIAEQLATDELAAILTSGALNLEDQKINVRYPSDDDELIDLNEKDQKVTANDYASDYKGLSWSPVTLNVYKNSDVVESVAMANGEASFEATDYTHVAVVYELKLTNFDDSVILDVLNTAVKLSNAAYSQIKDMDYLVSQIGQLEQVTFAMLSAATGLGKYYELDTTIPALEQVLEKCFDSADNMILLTHVKNYEAQGLAYFYQNNNYADILEQLDFLKTQMNLIVPDGGLKAALESMGEGDKYELIPKVAAIFDGLTMAAPEAEIDLESEKLLTLVSALEKSAANGEIAEYTSLEKGLVLTAEPQATRETLSSVKVTINVEGQKPVTITQAYEKGFVLTELEIQVLKNAVVDAVKELNQVRYETTYKAEELDALVGQTVTDVISKEFTWSVKEIETDSESVSIDTDNMTITLAGSDDSRYLLVYTVAGKEIEVSGSQAVTVALSKYFTEAEIDALFVADAVKVSVEKSDKYYDKLVAFVERLNSAISNDTLTFTLVENNGEFSIAMNVDSVSGLMTAVQEFATVLAGKDGYSYVGLENANGGFDAFFEATSAGTFLSIEALMNAILAKDGVGTPTILNAITVDGKVNVDAIPEISGTVLVYGKAGDMDLGAELFKTQMGLGANANDVWSTVDFYITLNTVPSQLATARAALEKVKNNIIVQTKDGKVEVTVDVPEKAYEAYLTALILTGRADLTDVDAVNSAIAYGYLYDMMMPIIEDGVTTTTYTNTLQMLGQDIDLTQYENLFQKLVAMKDNVTTSADEDNYLITLSAAVKAVIDNNLNLADAYKTMIKEYKNDTTLTVDVVATLKDAGTRFQGLVIDPYHDKTINKADYTTDLVSRVQGIDGAAVVVLLDNVVGDLNFSATTILDLNGFTLDGSITSSGKLIIVDSSMDTVNCGEVTGDVSGNVIVVGGKYADTVTEFLKEGYVQVDGVVSNKVYTITADADGNITFNVNSEILTGDIIPSVYALAADIAWDLAVNYFTAASLSIDGNGIYAVNFDDLLGLLAGENTKLNAINEALAIVDMEGIEDFINAVIEDVLDFAAIESAVNNDEAVFSYEFLTKAWDVQFKHVEDGDYLTVGIVPGVEDSFTVSVKVVGDNKSEVSDLAGALDDIVVDDGTEITIDLNPLTYADKYVNVVAGGKAMVELDLSKDANYAVIIGVVLGYGNSALKADMLAAVENYYETGSVSEIEAVFNKVTVNQLFTALKVMNRGTGFAAMAEAVGLTVDVSEAAALEKAYHKILIVAGAVLDRLDIQGGTRTMESVLRGDKYVIDKLNVNRAGSVEIAKGYGVSYDLTIEAVSLTVKLFADQPAIVVTDDADKVVYTGLSVSDAFAAVVGNGYTVTFNAEVAMTEDISTAYQVTVVNAKNLNMAEYVIRLTAVDASVTSDGALTVYVDPNLDGYIVKVSEAEGTYVYTVEEIAAPVTGAPVAGSLVEKINGTRYLIVDLEPLKGMTWEAFIANAVFEDFDGLIARANGITETELVKTADKVAFVAYDAFERVVAKITYAVVVLGDTNCNGLVNSSDAPFMLSIYLGETDVFADYSAAQLAAIKLAADANWNGRVNSSDVTTIMFKYFHWNDTYTTFLTKE